MEELLSNEVVRSKIKTLSPEIRRAFIESLLDLFEQETEDMIGAIEESRMELRGAKLDFEDETEQLRAESRMLEQRRMQKGKHGDDSYGDKKGRRSQASRADSRVSYVNEQGDEKSRDAVLEYIRRKNRGTRKTDDVRSPSSLSVPSLYSHSERPDSVQSSRSLPTPVMSRKTMEEESDAIMKNLTSADMKLETERHRQAELIEKRRQMKSMNKKTTEEKALELLEKALLIDKQLTAKKELQNQKLQERLEEMKRKKEKEKSERSSESRSSGIYEDMEKY